MRKCPACSQLDAFSELQSREEFLAADVLESGVKRPTAQRLLRALDMLCRLSGFDYDRQHNQRGEFSLEEIGTQRLLAFRERDTWALP